MIPAIDPGNDPDQSRQVAAIPCSALSGTSSAASLLADLVLVILITRASEPALWKLS